MRRAVSALRLATSLVVARYARPSADAARVRLFHAFTLSDDATGSPAGSNWAGEGAA
jgi:hypothetical protein